MLGLDVFDPVTMENAHRIGSGGHTLTVAAYNANGKILGQPKTVQLKGRQLAQGSTISLSLYVIAVGITHYSDHSLDDGVKFAAADARKITAKLKEQEGKGLYQKVIAVPLEDRQATVKGIREAVTRAAKNVQPGDTFVLYLAGHGVAVDGEYYFIPWEAEYPNRAEFLGNSLNREMIQNLLKQIPTNKSVLLLDTCSAGAFVEGRDAALDARDAAGEKAAIGKVAVMSGRAVLAASNTERMAMEGYRGHGVFTFFLLQGLRAADSDAQGQDTYYAARRVRAAKGTRSDGRKMALPSAPIIGDERRSISHSP